MSSFTSHLHQIAPESSDAPSAGHHQPAPPTPVDLAALFRLVQDQVQVLLSDAPTAENRDLLQTMASALDADIHNPPDRVPGVSQEYLDTLDRVPRRRLPDDDNCPICTERYLDDPYCLVVELPCPANHRFDLECVGPWLQSKGNCPMCRHDLTQKKKIEIPPDDEEEEDDVNGLYG